MYTQKRDERCEGTLASGLFFGVPPFSRKSRFQEIWSQMNYLSPSNTRKIEEVHGQGSTWPTLPGQGKFLRIKLIE